MNCAAERNVAVAQSVANTVRQFALAKYFCRKVVQQLTRYQMVVRLPFDGLFASYVNTARQPGSTHTVDRRRSLVERQ